MTEHYRNAGVESALAALFPPDVAVAIEPIQSREFSLWPEEMAAIMNAVPSRKAEFMAGRLAARRCLSKLGRAPVALPMADDRAPIWPQGLFGSISHTGGLAVAVVSETGPLGVDIELDHSLDAELWPHVCRVDELEALPETDRGRWVRQIFAIKEAVFKAQTPTKRVMFGFETVKVDLTGNGFSARFLKDVGEFGIGDEVQGRVTVMNGFVLAGVVR